MPSQIIASLKEPFGLTYLTLTWVNGARPRSIKIVGVLTAFQLFRYYTQVLNPLNADMVSAHLKLVFAFIGYIIPVTMTTWLSSSATIL